MPFGKRASLWRDLVRDIVKEPHLQQPLLSIIDRASNLRPKRDMVVHGLWHLWKIRKRVVLSVMYRHTKELRIHSAELTTQDMEKLAKEIGRISADLYKVSRECRPYFSLLPPPIHRTPFYPPYNPPPQASVGKPRRQPRAPRR